MTNKWYDDIDSGIMTNDNYDNLASSVESCNWSNYLTRYIINISLTSYYDTDKYHKMVDANKWN